jgi:hypothetical protein
MHRPPKKTSKAKFGWAQTTAETVTEMYVSEITVEVDVLFMHRLPKKTSKAKFDWLQATAETVALLGSK